MADLTAEKFAQRAFDCDLVDAHQLEAIWGELGSRDVPLNHFTALTVRKELLTNFQVDRLIEGKRDGYFYGSYKVQYMVGAGTFARVYRAQHRETKRDRAVKVLRKRYADDPVTTEQFLREARMVMPLRHPNIVPVYEVLEEVHRPFMVMDFVEGQNLRDFIKVRKSLEQTVALRLIGDVLAGLHYAVGKGVTHRDMKLSNVLISSHGRAKLVDFGLAAISADMSEEAIAAAPNPRSIDYAGLERITGVRKNDRRSDIYFTGCILYHMLAGRPPLFETRDRMKRLSVGRFRDVPPLGQLVPGLPNYVIAFCNRAMDLKPERRYQTPGEMLEELNHVIKRVKAGDTGVVATVPDTTPTEDADQTLLVGGAPLEREGEDRKIMLVESNVKLQDAIRDALKRRGYRVLVFGSPSRALQRFQDHMDSDPLADCVIFSAGELGEEAIDAFNAFVANDVTRSIPAIVLVGRAVAANPERVKVDEQHILLPLGLKIRELRSSLMQLLGAGETSSS